MISFKDLVAALADLTGAQRDMLRTLGEIGKAATIGDIAARLNLHPNTARETLESLVNAQVVVKRINDCHDGPGRPAWVYEPVAPTSLLSFNQHVANFTHATAKFLLQLPGDPNTAARQLGSLWAEEFFATTDVPDHQVYDRLTPKDSLSVHISKLRVLLAAMGFVLGETRPDNCIELVSAPFPAEDSGVDMVMTQMYSALLFDLVHKLSRGIIRAILTPGDGIFAELHLHLNYDPRN